MWASEERTAGIDKRMRGDSKSEVDSHKTLLFLLSAAFCNVFNRTWYQNFELHFQYKSRFPHEKPQNLIAFGKIPEYNLLQKTQTLFPETAIFSWYSLMMRSLRCCYHNTDYFLKWWYRCTRRSTLVAKSPMKTLLTRRERRYDVSYR